MSSTIQFSTLRKGYTCSFFVSCEQYDVILYEYVLCFFSTKTQCLHVLQKLICGKQSLTACFSSHKNLITIQDSVDKVYVVTKRVLPPFVTFDSIDVCPVNFSCSLFFYPFS